MELFSKPSKKRKRRKERSDIEIPSSSQISASKNDEATCGQEESSAPVQIESGDQTDALATFADLGVCDWLVRSSAAMGIRSPTPVQRCAIPAALRGVDVMALAETGSGKTAAFVLPILQRLSEDPYGIFALIVTPTRELAIQISEQVSALGAPMGVRVCVVIGGANATQQGIEVQRRPHVVVATPGRLIEHIEGPQPPALDRLRFLVLDEADRILAAGFAPELRKILRVLPNPAPEEEEEEGCASEGRDLHGNSQSSNNALVLSDLERQGVFGRQTLLFSATMTNAIERLRKMASRESAQLFDLTMKQTMPATLSLEYLFVPAQVKLTYLVHVLRLLFRLTRKEDGKKARMLSHQKGGKKGHWNRQKKASALLEAGLSQGNADSDSDEDVGDGDGSGAKIVRAKSGIIFTGSCERCQELTQVLLELDVDVTCIHSLLSQRRRTAALGKFKSRSATLLVATDVASRGLDIPGVDLVVNYDMPRLPVDFVHRSGRTARAGKRGRALSLVTQHDISLVHAIEKHVGRKLAIFETSKGVSITDDDVLPLLNPVAKARHKAKQRLAEIGFDEQVEKHKAKAAKRRELLRLTPGDQNKDKEVDVADS